MFRIWPFGDTIHSLLMPFVDTRDAGDLIVTHTYLLIGFSVPLWLFPAGGSYLGGDTATHTTTHIPNTIKHTYTMLMCMHVHTYVRST